MVARITQTVIAARLRALCRAVRSHHGLPWARPNSAVRNCGKPRGCPVSTSTTTLIPARNGWPVLVARVEANAHRDALHDLHPVAAGVLRRQQRELLRRRRADALNGAVPFRVRIGVHRHRDRLPRPHIGQLRLLRIRVDPDMIRGDEIEGGHRGLQVLAGCDRGHVRHDAGERRLDDGVIELALRLVDLCLGLQILRVLRDRNVRVAGEPGELHLRPAGAGIRACSCRARA